MRIALFDSGIGGLTVLSHARRVLPSEEFLFFADRDHVPYGTKSVPAVRGYVREAFRFLVEKQGADAVVVACNTATSVAVDEMRRLYEVPIIGMEPAVKKALAQDGERRVLVTATPITINGEKLRRLVSRCPALLNLLSAGSLSPHASRNIYGMRLPRTISSTIPRSYSVARILTISRTRCAASCPRPSALWTATRERSRSWHAERGCARCPQERRRHHAVSLNLADRSQGRSHWRALRAISREPPAWRRLFED